MKGNGDNKGLINTGHKDKKGRVIYVGNKVRVVKNEIVYIGYVDEIAGMKNKYHIVDDDRKQSMRIDEGEIEVLG